MKYLNSTTKKYNVGKSLQTEDVFILFGLFFILIACKEAVAVCNFAKKILL